MKIQQSESQRETVEFSDIFSLLLAIFLITMTFLLAEIYFGPASCTLEIKF
jgi:hypothetical protein